ncbi:hypothetical protein TRFO_33555 [Tritrichomonas foetus]|uniref:Uncharacterized protein n=1 Tax=Tritrichomonas foetus TaxID=1144522 RepID=A0A1J4JQY2_9EUKA|nr:hypothetical protein TRFO_33555 [Tritrichomonas foetus]|eukprot:OHS99915.1 hypothetical protein TRFO_33555 [Tritrichomonas foetus]
MSKSDHILIKLAVASLKESQQAYYRAHKNEIDQTFINFINHKRSFNDCQHDIKTHFENDDAPLVWLKSILDVDPIPLPIPPSGSSKTHPWSTNEDKRLICGIHQFGLDNWTPISLFVGNGRSRVHCRQRWKRFLDPNISKTKWTPMEEMKLVEEVNNSDNKKNWDKIADKMEGRTDLQCKYKYNKIQAHEAMSSSVNKSAGTDFNGEGPNNNSNNSSINNGLNQANTNYLNNLYNMNGNNENTFTTNQLNIMNPMVSLQTNQNQIHNPSIHNSPITKQQMHVCQLSPSNNVNNLQTFQTQFQPQHQFMQTQVPQNSHFTMNTNNNINGNNSNQYGQVQHLPNQPVVNPTFVQFQQPYIIYPHRLASGWEFDQPHQYQILVNTPTI